MPRASSLAHESCLFQKGVFSVNFFTHLLVSILVPFSITCSVALAISVLSLVLQTGRVKKNSEPLKNSEVAESVGFYKISMILIEFPLTLTEFPLISTTF
jgi:hypothetical protein